MSNEQTPAWKNWRSVNANCRYWLEQLGHFSPTIDAQQKCVKGYTADPEGGGNLVKTYFTSKDLREIAAACSEAASWLDARALLAARQEQPK